MCFVVGDYWYCDVCWCMCDECCGGFVCGDVVEEVVCVEVFVFQCDEQVVWVDCVVIG